MPQKRPSPQLEKFYLKSKALADSGEIIDSDFLCHTFGVTKFGASCLLYMLNEGRFYPTLEKIYRRADDRKQNKENHYIEFTEKLPPFKEWDIFGDDMSKKQKALYVSMGVARFMSSEEFRQLRIGIYVNIDILVEEARKKLLAALDGKDAAYVKNHFCNKTVDEVKQWLKRMKYTKQQIDDALALLLS